jgi:hypothetical protein
MAEDEVVRVKILNGVEGYNPGVETTMGCKVAQELEKQKKVQILSDSKLSNKLSPSTGGEKSGKGGK